ncbi:NAD(P)-binding protein [Pradoshia sp. D12]|uniref:NAD(P)/FAD-dependent oxidoreductase n=1 Tax=Bacillaceae TaxID=186817 RepID=UPI0011224B16|nr:MULTISPECIES: NAD(P)/FAD-dependent oxidoreductase [Bacillaceae]QFK71619.1 NAD(P)-binding protein [Pradoshia sp. D12]TPF73414.1 FAD-dependent oxidoreductase [Bacillus sp. D12]
MLVLEPIKVGNLELKNRFVMVPMGAELGNFDPRTVDYYVTRAKGGASMVMTTVIATEAIDGHTPASTLTEESFAGFKELVDRAHEFDCKICLQVVPGIGLGGIGEGRLKPASASALPLYPGANITFEELTIDEIKFIQGEISRTVKLAKRAGADAIEIHAYGGYLTDKFMTKRWNIRQDEYGGSFENRMRFLTEIIDVIKEDLGSDFPLLVKFTPDHFLPVEEGYRGIEEGIEIAKLLESKGVHALHVDAGCHDNWYIAMPPIYQQDMVPQMISSAKIKAVTSLPVLSNGRLGDIEKAEAALRNGWIDIAGVGREFLADPNFPKKVMENRTDEIRHCIYCNEGCIATVAAGKSINCAVNPLTGYEGLKELKAADESKRVLVIGAGPGGCQAAITAAEAGHDVEIWEKKAYLGGNFHNACMPPFKRDGMKILDYYRTKLDRLNISIRYCKEATEEAILSYKADLVVHATGGNPIMPSAIKGLNKSHVYTATDVLQNQALLGKKISVIGGGLVGCETAVVLANKGMQITIIEMAEKMLPEPLFIQNAMMLNQLLQHPNITFKTSAKVTEVLDQAVEIEVNGNKEWNDCDSVVVAAGFSPNNHLYHSLKNKTNIVNVGDSVKVRKVLDAVHEAYDAVLNL